MGDIRFLRRGSGSPILLVHDLGGSSDSWSPILNSLADQREVIAVDLPGSGGSPPLTKPATVANLADAVTEFLDQNGWIGIDAVGVAAGGRVALELAKRQGVLGSTVALSPSGFCRGLERHAYFASMMSMHLVSVQLQRRLHHMLPKIAQSQTGRMALLALLSHHPSRVPPHTLLTAIRGEVDPKTYIELLDSLAFGDPPETTTFGSIHHPLVIAWGRNDRLSLPHEAWRALEYFPDAKLRWFNDCGHYPQWDVPDEVVRMILENTKHPHAHRARTAVHVQ